MRPQPGRAGPRFRRLLAVLLCAAPAAPSASAASGPLDWWNSAGAAGDLLGARDVLGDRGLNLRGRYRGAYFGVLSSEKGSASFLSQEVVFGAALDFGKLTGWRGLEGLEAFGDVRWRDTGSYINPNTYVEADRPFGPSRYVSGREWRLLAFGLRYVTPEMLGVKDLLSLTGGWLRPQQEFALSPMSNLFVNNALASGRGIGGNIPFSSSFSSWGGIVEVKPTPWHYTKAGLFMSYPDATGTDNHGLLFQGDPSDPAHNGLYFMGETGLLPSFGPAKLSGKYSLGSYYYDEKNDDTGVARFGFYAQAEQTVFREPSTGGELSEQGLGLFTLWMFAPESSNDITFYFQGGLVYEGAIPGRDSDLTILALAVGQYSRFDAREAREAGDPEAGHTVVVEGGYRLQLNSWLFAQPFAQYIVQPDGTTAVADAALLGLLFGADF